jgi:protein tyrosine/serine phosphatase
MKRPTQILSVALVFWLAALTGQAVAEGQPSREKWAETIASPLLKNFHRVSEDLYRGAQPSAEGMKEIVRLGIRTVINLRSWNSDDELLRGTAIRPIHIRTNAWGINDDEVVRFLRAMNKKEDGPFFLHCKHGADRTGAMAAMYRMAFQGWTKEEAIREMTQGDFGFHAIWKPSLLRYIRKVDVQALKQKAGVK